MVPSTAIRWEKSPRPAASTTFWVSASTFESAVTMVFSAAIMLVASPSARWTSMLMSPPATRWAMAAASPGSPPTCRLIRVVTVSPRAMARTMPRATAMAISSEAAWAVLALASAMALAWSTFIMIILSMRLLSSPVILPTVEL